MLPSIRTGCCQGQRSQWQQRLSTSSLPRQRQTQQELSSSIIHRSESTIATRVTGKSTIIRRYSGIRHNISLSNFALPSAPPSLPLFKSSSLTIPSRNRVIISRTKLKLIRSSSSSSSAISRQASSKLSKAFSSEAAKAGASDANNSADADGDSIFSYFGVLFQRLAMSLGIVYVVTEYGIEWTVCEGPSMMPTIKPRGEIVVIDRFTPQLFGIQGGDTIAKRTEFAKRSQDEHVQNRKRIKKKEREWLLRLYQQEEEKLLQRNHQQEEMSRLETSEIEREETESTQQSPPTNFPDSNSKHALLEQGSQSQSPSSNQTSSNVEILRALREDLERSGDDDNDDDETWYETRIPVNKLPPEGAWDRFRTQISTGISIGDVVVLQHPDRIGTVCKRVMGLPGDIVTKPSSRIGANRLEDMLHGGRRAAALRQSSGAGGTPFPLFLESEQERLRRNKRNKRRLLSSGLQVPDGHIWVEGDNPWNSSDSRNYGTVPASLIMGRVLLRLWPIRGGALMERGDRPVRSDGDELSMAFSGSIVVPVGWDDQKIVREFVPPAAISPSPAEPPTMAVPESVER